MALDRDLIPRVHAESRAEWRAWLIEHHETSTGVNLVSWRKATGKPAVSYDDAVAEALAVGWVDSRPGKLDDERTMLYFSPRKPTSAWSRPNKVRIERLRASGLMLPAGEAAIARAIENRSWSRLDDIEDGIEPPELAAALDAVPAARANWDAFPKSAKRGILEWIVQAKRPETRDARIAETVRLAAVGERANQWRPKDASARS